jgi:outer membrane protein OmpA-like peptidoglycan-associated protein
MQARNTERGIVLTLGDVLFDTNEADLTSGAMDNIDRIADFMKSYPERIAIVEGHTDNMGETDYNMDLSSDRAFAVRQALAKKGISTSRITTRGFGMDKPVASNQTSAGRQENRRVEIIFPDSPTQISELSD